MSELKPCPFCGGEAEVRHSVTCGYDSYWVECKDFQNCRGRVSPVTDVESIAVTAWNTRYVETCEVELRESGWGGYTRHCGTCGADLDCDTRNKQNYCPSCGRKVEQ